MNNPLNIELDSALSVVSQSDVFIFAAGYEDRARFIPEHVQVPAKIASFAVQFERGPIENLRGEQGGDKLRRVCDDSNTQFQWLPYDIDRALEFEDVITEALRKVTSLDVTKIAVDISGMPQFVIMEVFASLRVIFPAASIIVIFVSAVEYPPSSNEIIRFLKARESRTLDSFQFGLNFEPGEPLYPRRFAGVGQRRGKSAMALFAGYERDRSHAAYDAVNPSKLILIHSTPQVEGAQARLEYSQAVHNELGGEVDRSVEVLDNLDVRGHVELLSEYYEWLYDLYDMVLVPVHSKFQAVACFLFWETYPDVQVMFPVPIRYKAESGGCGVGKIYQLTLPPHPRLGLFVERE